MACALAARVRRLQPARSGRPRTYGTDHARRALRYKHRLQRSSPSTPTESRSSAHRPTDDQHLPPPDTSAPPTKSQQQPHSCSDQKPHSPPAATSSSTAASSPHSARRPLETQPMTTPRNTGDCLNRSRTWRLNNPLPLDREALGLSDASCATSHCTTERRHP